MSMPRVTIFAISLWVLKWPDGACETCTKHTIMGRFRNFPQKKGGGVVCAILQFPVAPLAPRMFTLKKNLPGRGGGGVHLK